MSQGDEGTMSVVCLICGWNMVSLAQTLGIMQAPSKPSVLPKNSYSEGEVNAETVQTEADLCRNSLTGKELYLIISCVCKCRE